MADHRTGYNRFHGLQVGPSPWWKSSQTVSEDPHGLSPNAASSPWPAWLLLGRSGTSGQGDHAPGTDVFRVADWYRNHPGTSSTDVDCQQNLQLVICNIQCTFMLFFFALILYYYVSIYFKLLLFILYYYDSIYFKLFQLRN